MYGLTNSFKNSLKKMTDFLVGEHKICVNNDWLLLFEEKIQQSLNEKEIHDGKVVLKNDCLNVTGRFAHAGGGKFEANLTPEKVVWTKDKHSIYFKIKEKNVVMDKKISNFIASSASRTCQFFFGDTYLDKKIGLVNDDGLIEVCLDNTSRHIDMIIQSIHLSRLECQDSELCFYFSINTKEAIANRSALTNWIKELKAKGQSTEKGEKTL